MSRPLVRTLLLVLLSAAAVVLPSTAHAKFVFDKNHPDLQWYTIETEHFHIHYPVSKKTAEEGNEHYLTAEFAARKTAKISEEMWGPMCEEFDFYLKEKIHIVLLNQSDHLEGFTIPAWDWIEVSANVGGYFWRMRGRMEWFSDVMVHEFAHVVSLKANAPISESAFGLFLGGLYSNGKINADIGGEVGLVSSDPFWWSEGGAEFWSDETDYNWWTSSRDQNIRTTVLEERLLTYDEWGTRAEKRDWGDGERGYQQGYSIALYLRDRFGPEVFGQFALKSRERLRFEWEDVIYEVTGVEAETLYNDWVEFLTEKYGDVQDGVKADGEVIGQELLTHAPPDAYRDPGDRDEWMEKLPRDREDAKEATGTWITEPRYSESGDWYGVNNRAMLTIKKAPEEVFLPFSGSSLGDAEVEETMSDLALHMRMEFGHGFDFVPGQDQVVLTSKEDSYRKGYVRNLLGLHGNHDGYNWKQLWVLDLKEYERKEKGREYTSLTPDDNLGVVNFGDALRKIPNTLRGVDPAVAPDGETVAFFEYTDGTLNLVTIQKDGSGKTYLTSYNDGTWMQRVDWSPDGKHLVFQMFRNYRYDLWKIDADGSNLTPLTWDRVEEMDVHWAKDGRIYFAADPTGIFNIFAMDAETGTISQITNVVSAAQLPFLTPQGNLLYVQFTAHGSKAMGLHRSEFLERDATHLFGQEAPSDESLESFITFEEDLTHFADSTRKYKSRKSYMVPSAFPMVRVSNDSLASFGVQAGGQLYMQDFVEDHVFVADAMLGEDMDASVRYQYQGWHANILAIARRLEGKSDYGFRMDEDENPDTTTDQKVFDGKQVYSYNIGAFGTFYQISPRLLAFAIAQAYSQGFKGTDDSSFQPFKNSYSGYLSLSYHMGLPSYSTSPNPRGGRVFDFSYTNAYTDIVYAAYNGVAVDDGEELDAYSYNQYELRWTEQVAITDYLNKWLDRPERDPTLQVDMQLGWTDKNVGYGDEFRAGGRHPYWFGPGAVQPNTQFAGYPASSLAGETMAVMNVAYRFPVFTKLNKRVGPLYVYDMYAQVMATAGNLWSYRPPSEPGSFYSNRYGEPIAYDTDDIYREVPFKDYAYKNQANPDECADWDPKCTLLYDIGAEVRLSSTLFHGGWNSFFRVAYGLSEIRGIGDVDGDGITSNTDSQMGDTLSSETEDYRLRFYLGLGTGW